MVLYSYEESEAVGRATHNDAKLEAHPGWCNGAKFRHGDVVEGAAAMGKYDAKRSTAIGSNRHVNIRRSREGPDERVSIGGRPGA